MMAATFHTRVGFTGTRSGMTMEQKQAFDRLILSLPVLMEFHHGDCVGADDDAANIVHQLRGEYPGSFPWMKVFCHPPSDETHRANNPHYDYASGPKTHFARNRDIVNKSDCLIACPPYPTPITEQTRGGTAYTVNYARKMGKPVLIIWPDGTMSAERSEWLTRFADGR